MRKILLVDDEPKVLQGLQRMLRSMRHEWDTEFATSGQEALEILSKSPFDVIVSDMRMPGMDGVQLLMEVMKKYPNVVRIILSGQTDQEAFLSSSGIMHQFLSKPCDTELLKAAITRSCTLQGLLKNESLKKLVLQTASLPSLSKLYTEIIHELQSPNTSMEKIGQIISKDLGMTTKVLQLVNSAFYGLRRRISNPTEAAVVLGLNSIKSLVLSYHMFSRLEHFKLPGFSPDTLWKHSMIVGSFARQIARIENYSSKMIDDAFVAGMLHDLGKLVLVANLPEQYNKKLTLIQEKGLSHLDAEHEVFNGTHAEVGAYLIGLWGITDTIVEALAFHHNPGTCPTKTFTLVTAVHVANVLGNETCPSEIGAGSPVDYDYIAGLGLSERLSVWRESCQKMRQEGNV
ncbi:MAG TPA: HDOD domain-containing protein [Candidatus Wunengus sp. YC60]|uniref:HDOD domain-containing protein n=1 Tax=Candidatus Wunengus sp. YC60 TaxID=3367697 RepID=UPI0040297A2A